MSIFQRKKAMNYPQEGSHSNITLSLSLCTLWTPREKEMREKSEKLEEVEQVKPYSTHQYSTYYYYGMGSNFSTRRSHDRIHLYTPVCVCILKREKTEESRRRQSENRAVILAVVAEWASSTIIILLLPLLAACQNPFICITNKLLRVI